MPELPASVRIALWVTGAWRRGDDVAAALASALPDVDHVEGDLARLEIWRDLGESALLVALPAPGDLAGLPPAPAEAVAAATGAGECVLVPGIGGMLVPQVARYGSEAEPGTLVRLRAHDADPVPRHRVEALDGADLERRLREALVEVTEELTLAGGKPFASTLARDVADTRLGGDRWGLPPGLPGRVARVVQLAGTAGAAARLGLDGPDGALDAATASRRTTLLRGLARTADRVLADATNAGCAALAGWTGDRVR